MTNDRTLQGSLRILLGLILSIAVFAFACAGSNQGDLRQQLIGTEWLLNDLAGTAVADDVRTTLKFGEEDRLTGHGGCNGYFGQIQWGESGIKIGPLGATRMACEGAPMEQEDLYFQVLEKASEISRDGDDLVITCTGYDAPLRFSQVSVSE